MSRIQTILDKAEREGTARRFRVDILPDVDPHGEVVRADATSLPAAPPAPPLSIIAAAPGAGSAHATPVVPMPPDARRAAISGPPAAPDRDATGRAVMEPVIAEPAHAPDPQFLVSPADARVDAGSARADATPARVAQRLPLSAALVAALHPNALASEQFRTLRTRIANSANGRGARTLLVTSPGRGEGKSVMAANLALTMGQEMQQRVCLVDCSLRDAAVHALFGLPETPGLADVLRGDASLDDALVPLGDYQLTILPAGRLPTHPAELLASRDMRKTLDILRSRFDRVVIDAPAAQPMADVSILLPLVDGALLIVRAGVTGTPAIQQALGSLDQSRVLGIVLNDIQN